MTDEELRMWAVELALKNNRLISDVDAIVAAVRAPASIVTGQRQQLRRRYGAWRTAERTALIRDQYPTIPSLRDLLDALNEMAGTTVSNGAMCGYANKTLGLRRPTDRLPAARVATMRTLKLAKIAERKAA